MATKTILLDVGGTFIKCSDGRSIPINSNGTREEIKTSLCAALGNVDEAAIAMPGPFNYATGKFLMKHKFAAVYGETLAELCEMPNTTFHFVHDVNGMLLGEMKYGIGRNFQRVALVTLGTGLGFSMSVDGKLVVNENGSPLKSIYDLPYKGVMLEDYASKRGVLKAYGAKDDNSITVKEIAEKAFQGEEKAQQAFLTVGEIVAQTIAPILEEYGIECLLFGGQISRSFALLEPALLQGLKSVTCVKHVGPISDIDNATFNGLKALL